MSNDNERRKEKERQGERKRWWREERKERKVERKKEGREERWKEGEKSLGYYLVKFEHISICHPAHRLLGRKSTRRQVQYSYKHFEGAKTLEVYQISSNCKMNKYMVVIQTVEHHTVMNTNDQHHGWISTWHQGWISREIYSPTELSSTIKMF